MHLYSHYSCILKVVLHLKRGLLKLSNRWLKKATEEKETVPHDGPKKIFFANFQSMKKRWCWRMGEQLLFSKLSSDDWRRDGPIGCVRVHFSSEHPTCGVSPDGPCVLQRHPPSCGSFMSHPTCGVFWLETHSVWKTHVLQIVNGWLKKWVP